MALTQETKFNYSDGEVCTSFEKDGTPYTVVKARFEATDGTVPTFLVESRHEGILQIDSLQIEVNFGTDNGVRYEQIMVTTGGRRCSAKGKPDARKNRNADHFYRLSDEAANAIVAATDLTTVPPVLADAFTKLDMTSTFLSAAEIVGWMTKSGI
jgi:hypothetical protein